MPLLTSVRAAMPQVCAEEKIPASTIQWRIQNIGSWVPDFHPWKISSPVFALNNLVDSEWTLCFIPAEGKGFEICINQTRFAEKVSIVCDWSLLDCNGVPLLTRTMECETGLNALCHFMFDSHETGDVILNRTSIFLANGTLNVRLRIRKTKEDFAQSENISLVTRILDKSPDEPVVWRIERFRALQLKSEAVATIHLKGHRLQVKFFLTGESLDDAVINFGVVVENDNIKSLKVKISILDKDNKSLRCMEKQHNYNSTEHNQTWFVSNLVSRREILENPSHWLCDGDLIFLCEFACHLRSYTRSYIERSYFGLENPSEDMESGNATEDGEERKQCPRSIISTITEEKVQTSLFWKRVEQKNASRTALGEDLLRLYNEHILSDFELFSGNSNISFSVHKVILVARSKFFKDLFCGDEKESNLKFLRMDDLEFDTLRRFVSFLYSETLNDLPWGCAGKLYYAADKYKVPSLMLECSKALRSNIALSNVSEILELADKYQDKELRSDVHDFIQEHFDEVVLSDEWDSFLERSCLAGKVMKEVYKRRNASLRSLCEKRF